MSIVGLAMKIKLTYNITQGMEPTNVLVLNSGFDKDQMLSVWDINIDGFQLIFIKMGTTI